MSGENLLGIQSHRPFVFTMVNEYLLITKKVSLWHLASFSFFWNTVYAKSDCGLAVHGDSFHLSVNRSLRD